MRFNKEGSMLAVTTADGGLKVLANADGMKYLRAIEARSYETSKAPVERIFCLSEYHLLVILMSRT